MKDKHKPEKQKVATVAELKRLKTQSDELRGLTTLPSMAKLTPKRHDKLIAQLDKLDRVILKITRLTS